jgi:diguanylate cyclase (GGDEF)-like protein
MHFARARIYPAVGALLALGAPLGLIVVRAAIAPASPTPGWLAGELRADAVTYVYLVVATTSVFATLGFLLGRKGDLLDEKAATDALTGLSNRRAFDARLTEELARASRYGTPLSFLAIDVDGLKAINDKTGHAAGDAALRAVGRALRESCRRTDVPARTGGDEFAILAPMTRSGEALELASRLRRTLASIPAAPTVSVGVADLALAGSPGALPKAADRALYQAKSEGRDRAVLAEPPTRAAREPLDDCVKILAERHPAPFLRPVKAGR